MEKIRGKLKSAAGIAAVALSFVLYALSFDPFGVAEFAYIFAVPAILALRIVWSPAPLYEFGKDEGESALERFKKFGISMRIKVPESKDGEAESDIPAAELKPANKKAWYISTFACSYLAWVAILAWLRHVFPPAGWAAMLLLPAAISALFIWPWFAALPRLLPKLNDAPHSRFLKLLGAAGFWVVLEWLRSFMFTGFPWLLLGHSQWQRPAVIQTAAYGGVWAVSFILIFFNLAIAEYLYRLYEHQRFKILSKFTVRPPFSRFTPEFYLALLLALLGAWIYLLNLPRPENEEKAFRVGMIQTDFAGILKWDDKLAADNLEVVKRLTIGLNAGRADVAIWPEAATPPRYPVIGVPEMRVWVESLSKDFGGPIIMGNMAYLADEDAAQNGVFTVSPENGLGEDYYAKRKLVPFGEYVPAWASFLGKVVPVGNMKRGEYDKPLEIDIKGENYKIGPMICYEDIFPSLGREMALKGADILYVCTNDSWYGREGGAWQHAAHSALQAVSTRKPLMRASNNGLSTVFDQYGRMRPCTVLRGEDGKVWDASTHAPEPALEISSESGQALDARTLSPKRPSPMLDDNGSIYFRGAGYADLVFYKNFENGESFYVRHGDWVVLLSALFFAASIAGPLYVLLKFKFFSKKA